MRTKAKAERAKAAPHTSTSSGKLGRVIRILCGLSTGFPVAVSFPFSLVKDFTDRGIRLVSVSESWLDTASPCSELTLAVLAWAGQQERKRIKERQRAGIQAAKAKGKRWGGRKPGTFIKRSAELDTLVRKLKVEKTPVTQIARLTNLSRETVYTILDSEA
jgi:DNA invertase Pin-like site-specific DNA recombinase